VLRYTLKIDAIVGKRISVYNSDLYCPIYHHNGSRLPARTSMSTEENGLAPDVGNVAPLSVSGLEVEDVADALDVSVGAPVGSELEGADDGVELGSLDGTEDGALDGSELGWREGPLDGSSDGTEVGFTEGVLDGAADGSALGISVGAPLGSIEGAALG
jgi:hypothetical protein